MSAWADPRKLRGEECAFAAEQADAVGDMRRAHDLYREAAENYRAVALSTPSEERDLRSVIGISAVACFARAGALDDAVALAKRLLAQGGALTAHGRAELLRMVGNYTELIDAERKRTRPAVVRATRMRDHVRVEPKVAA